MLSKKELLTSQHKLLENKTIPEVLFERRLTNAGVQFTSQAIVGFYIVDFLLPDRMLIIEIDGATHLNSEEKVYDARRTSFLKSFGFKVIRIDNISVSDFDLNRILNLPSSLSEDFEDAMDDVEQDWAMAWCNSITLVRKANGTMYELKRRTKKTGVHSRMTTSK